MANKRSWTAQEDELLRLAVARGISHRQIGHLVGRTKAAVGARADKLRRGVRRRLWSPVEDALIRDTASYRTAHDIARELGRSPAAVNTRASVLGARWGKPTRHARHSGLTSQDVATILGLSCAKTVVDWIEKGYLTGSRRAARLGTGRKVPWRIMPEALRAFLRDYPWLYDRSRINDRGWAAYVGTLPREVWVGTREAADLLCLTQAGVTRAMRRGDLRAEKVGANWRIPLASLRAYRPPPLGAEQQHDEALRDEIAARRAANLAARKSRTYTARPETVAAQVASRARRRLAA